MIAADFFKTVVGIANSTASQYSCPLAALNGIELNDEVVESFAAP